MKKTFKKLLAVALAVAATASLTACGSKKETYTVGICQLVQHEALDAATKGFKDALTEKLGDKVTFDEQNAQGDSVTCGTIVGTFVSKKVDLILANATAPLQAAANATETIPVLGTSITDYATALELKDFKGATGINVSGTSDLAPLDRQAQMIRELFPNAKKVGLVYCSAEPNSKYQVDKVRAELSKSGITCTDYTFVDSNDIAAVVQGAVANSEVLYIPTDNTAASNGEIIDSIASAAGIPIIAGEEGICKKCGVATLSISYYDIGYRAGEMAYEILVNGKDVSKMEIEYAPAVTKKYDAARAAALKLTVPNDYVKIGE